MVLNEERSACQLCVCGCKGMGGSPHAALAKLPDALVNTLMGQAGAGHGLSTQELQSVVVVEVMLHVQGGRRCHGTIGCTAPCQQRTCTVTLHTILQYGRQSP